MKIARCVAILFMFVGAAHATPIGEWRLDERFTNTIIAQIDLEDAGTETARAFLRCHNGRQLDAVIIVGPALAGRRTPVRYRFDEGAWTSATWLTTSGGNGVFADDARALAAQLAARSTLVFEAEGHDGEMHQVQFPLRGSRDPIARTLAACGA